MKEEAIVLTNGLLDQTFAKTCHGLIRGTNRFNLLGVIDHVHAGKEAGEVLDGTNRGISVFPSVGNFLRNTGKKPKYLVIGVAFPGGALPVECRGEIIEAIKNGISIVCGLHQFLNDDAEFTGLAKEHGVELIDIRKSRPTSELHYWNGDIYQVKASRIAVLGTDCIIGKRTTCRFILEACQARGIRAEMIFTGQTGWLQGYQYGFILDATVNDFISGEIERSIVTCDRDLSPDLILLEGQSSLQNPSGPCGSEFIISGNIKGVILQHAPGRTYYKHKDELGCKVASIESEIALINAYGAEVLAVTLSDLDATASEMQQHKERLAGQLGIPVIRPLVDGTDELFGIVNSFMARDRMGVDSIQAKVV